MNEPDTTSRTLSYRKIRGLVGIIALAIAAVTALVSNARLDSISESYHYDSQDFFVGSLFIVAAFLATYNGSPNAKRFRKTEFAMAKIAAAAVFVVALFPTDAESCADTAAGCAPGYIAGITAKLGTTSATVHGVSAVAFFAMLFGLMLIFAHRAWGKSHGGACRAVFYSLCCAGMLAAVCLVLIHEPITPGQFGAVYWAEYLALISFGAGWLYSGAYEVLSESVGKRLEMISCPAWLVRLQ